MGRLGVGAVVRLPRSLVGDVAMADPPILIDFGDNPDDWDRNPRPDQLALPIEFPDREHRLVPRSPAVTRQRRIEDVETKEDLL